MSPAAVGPDDTVEGETMAANTPPPPPPNASGPKPGAPQGQPAPANPDLSGQLAGWRIAAVVLAIIAVIAIIWGIIVNNDLRTQVDSLNAQVAELQKANTAVTEKSQAQATVSQVQIKNLQTEVDQLKDSLTAVGKLSKSTLKAVGTEYSALEQELQESQNQVKALQQQAADSDATSEELAAAYAKAQGKLLVAQARLTQLLNKISKVEASVS